MTKTVAEEPETITLELDCETGAVTLVGGHVPAETTWTPELLDIIRRGGALWCSITDGVIEMRIRPETLWYRLTGAADDFGGQVAIRCDAEGEPWSRT